MPSHMRHRPSRTKTLASPFVRAPLYTVVYKLAASVTSEPAELPQADVLVLESTYGEPQYRFADRDSIVAELIDVVRRALAAERTPIIEAYALGKAQEVTRLL